MENKVIEGNKKIPALVKNKINKNVQSLIAITHFYLQKFKNTLPRQKTNLIFMQNYFVKKKSLFPEKLIFCMQDRECYVIYAFSTHRSTFHRKFSNLKADQKFSNLYQVK